MLHCSDRFNQNLHADQTRLSRPQPIASAPRLARARLLCTAAKLAFLCAAHTHAQDDERDGGLPPSTYSGMPSGENEANHQRFAQLRRDEALQAIARAERIAERAAAGECGLSEQRRAQGYRDVLDSVHEAAARAEQVFENTPSMAAGSYQRVGRMAQRVLDAAATGGCTP